MIHSIFILNSTGEVIIEKHYRGNTSRTESGAFWNQTAKSARGVPTDVPPFLPTPKGALIHLHRNGLFFLASVLTDTQPLFVTQFLESLADIFVDYFGELNEHAIKDNFITVYELLDEMLDNGFPLTVEPNTLKELITPPSMINRMFESLGADSGKTVNMSLASPNAPWRRANVKYAQNEIFVDVIETINATYSATRRNQSHLVIAGVVKVNCRLSGNPDLAMRVRANAPFNDVALHHCVRLARYEESGQLAFVPPDGPFTLMTYKIRDTSSLSLPIDVQSKITFDHDASSGAVSISLVPRFASAVAPPVSSSSSSSAPSGSMILSQVMNAAGGKAIRLGEPESVMDSVSVRIPFGRFVTGSSLSANYGTVQFESSTGTCTWDVGAVPRGKTPALVGQVTLQDGSASVAANPPILVSFRIPGFSSSGVIVESLDLLPPERYKYYKGLRCITKAGLYEVRT